MIIWLTLILGWIGPGDLQSTVNLQEPLLTSNTRVLAAPDRLLVRVPNEESKQLCETLGFQVIREIPQIDYTVLRVPYGQVDETAQLLRALKIVEEAYPDRAYKMAFEPNDPRYPNQWSLARMNLPTAWDITQGDPNIKVAILDTGVDYHHPDLASNIWTNPGEIPNNGIDDDGNGYIDDYWGWDFAYVDNDPMDDHGHGTACAGIVAAATNNGIGMAGIAFRCKLMCVKIGLSDGYSYDSMFAPAVIYAADMGAKVQSISYFSDDLTPALRAATDYAWKRGSLLIVAAGNYNEPWPVYPAGYDNAVGVAATTQNDQKASFSNVGSWVDVGAPGVSIVATSVGGGYTNGFSGTSAAAPNAAGVVALLWSLAPNAKIETIREALEYSSETLNDPVSGSFMNYGRVNAAFALQLLQSVALDPNGFALWNPITPAIHWISPHRMPSTGGRLTLAGRYFGHQSGWGKVKLNGQALNILEWYDGKIVVEIPRRARPGWLEVTARGIRSNRVWLQLESATKPMTAAPTDRQMVGLYGGGASLAGSYPELLEADGQVLNARARNDNQQIVLKLLVRGLDKERIRSLDWEYLRQFQNTTAGAAETIELYDFSSGSYPYGQFVGLYSGSAMPDSQQLKTGTAPGDVSRFVSYEGDLFVRITVQAGNSNGRLLIDKLWFRWKE